MVDKLEIYAVDETWVQVVGEKFLIKELSSYLTYEVPNAKFTPAYKNRQWDGKIRLINFHTQQVYKGLVPYIQKWCAENSYECVLEKELIEESPKLDIQKFIESLKLTLTPYDFQFKAIEDALTRYRLTFLSPTSSGKSLIIYCIMRYFLETMDKKILIVVPTTSLIHQLVSDFSEYCPDYPIDDLSHKIYSGQEKDSDKRIWISTWQSIYKLKKQFFKQFDAIIVDEAHGCKAEGLKGILEKAVETKYRIGLTGTLDGLEFNRLVIEGLCGPVSVVAKTNELIKRKIVSELSIQCCVLKYSDEIRKANKAFNYQNEQSFIVNYQPRNKLIANIVAQTKDKNLLVITQFKEHIKLLKAEIEKTGKTVYCVSGDIEATEREKIRKLTETQTNVVIIATYGVFSTGISIKNLQYIIFATGSKSLIRVLQTIGRVLRLDGKDNRARLIDIVDDFGYKKKRNYLLKHFFERIKIYTEEEHPYKITTINI